MAPNFSKLKTDNMKRLFSFALIAILFSPISKADEGMWLLHMLKQINEASMKDAGFRLTA